MEQVKIYKITGRTNAGHYVRSFFSRLLKEAMLNFIEKYPRFKGNAEILFQTGNFCEETKLIITNGQWETMDSFNSTREIKESYLKNHSV